MDTGRREFPKRIRKTFFLAFLLPITLFLLLGGNMLYLFLQEALDNALGERLKIVAHDASLWVSSYELLALDPRAPGGQTQERIVETWRTMIRETSVETIYLFDLDQNLLASTDPQDALGAALTQNELHRFEIQLALQSKRPQASLLFSGKNGRFYKSAFAPVFSNEGKIVAMVGVDGSADFFDQLQTLNKRMLLFGLTALALMTLITLIISKRIVRPIDQLVASAQAIGQGDLQRSVPVDTENELGFLAYVFNQMRENILKRQNEQELMLRGIAHEVRNPLGGMELHVGMLKEEIQDETSQRYLSRIRYELDNLNGIVNEFLDYGRGIVLQPQMIDMQSFFKDIRWGVEAACKAKDVELVIDIQTDKGFFDPEQIRRAFMNLIFNAIEATPEGTTVTLRAWHDQNQLHFSITDEGPGFNDEIKQRAFEPFYTTKQQGSGLGLSFVQKIVFAHGGSVSLDNVDPKGALIQLSLPTKKP